jgi:hypothetical protein
MEILEHEVGEVRAGGRFVGEIVEEVEASVGGVSG